MKKLKPGDRLPPVPFAPYSHPLGETAANSFVSIFLWASLIFKNKNCITFYIIFWNLLLLGIAIAIVRNVLVTRQWQIQLLIKGCTVFHHRKGCSFFQHSPDFFQWQTTLQWTSLNKLVTVFCFSTLKINVVVSWVWGSSLLPSITPQASPS